MVVAISLRRCNRTRIPTAHAPDAERGSLPFLRDALGLVARRWTRAAAAAAAAVRTWWRPAAARPEEEAAEVAADGRALPRRELHGVMRVAIRAIIVHRLTRRRRFTDPPLSVGTSSSRVHPALPAGCLLCFLLGARSESAHTNDNSFKSLV